MEESSHSTPSPMSSAASSQDSLHRGNSANLAASSFHNTLPSTGYHGGVVNYPPGVTSAQALAAAKKKGVKSTLGRIFGKKDKQLKALKVKFSFFRSWSAARF